MVWDLVAHSHDFSPSGFPTCSPEITSEMNIPSSRLCLRVCFSKNTTYIVNQVQLPKQEGKTTEQKAREERKVKGRDGARLLILQRETWLGREFF